MSETLKQFINCSTRKKKRKKKKKKLTIIIIYKSRKENPQKPTQLSSRSHPRHLVGKRTAQKTPS